MEISLLQPRSLIILNEEGISSRIISTLNLPSYKVIYISCDSLGKNAVVSKSAGIIQDCAFAARILPSFRVTRIQLVLKSHCVSLHYQIAQLFTYSLVIVLLFTIILY